MDLRNRVQQQGNFLTKSLLPDAPANVTASIPTATTVTLTWDAVGGASYRIYKDNVQVGTSDTNTYKVTGLTTATAYNFEVTAVINEVESLRSNKITVTTA
ncbi:fibronectin type III domain-containing protein [Metabacillus fastidiosus]|uniref:fibronectin type III domain-containing protein n=1 Tax=Metabacillus fastidiosus TaxID=1458 RepID=UPI0012E709A7|nr:fibronectin type III domain-containing protein [Metabacillus fastidiosus]MED4461863.1 fibronectin type III domain-containing protein [Metabacillus fastidiosus]